jgi:Flp pilus assembly pilin Flp
VKPPTNSRWSRVAAGVDPIFIVLIAGVLAIGGLVFWLWNASPAVLKHATHVAGALAPVAVLVAAIAAAIGWYVKRKITNDAVRDRVRARLKRIWEAIREAVRSKARYNPGSITFFLNEIQKIYWEVDMFAAFTRDEHDLLRTALDDCQLDNKDATRMVNDPLERWNPGECFLRSLEALEPVFRVVFGDEKIAAEIGDQISAITARTKTRD